MKHCLNTTPLLASRIHSPMRMTTSLLAFALTVSASGITVPPPIPDRPESLVFTPLRFEPPSAAEYRHTLPCGLTVFLAPSIELPLIDLSITFKGGSYLESADEIGLAGMTSALLRTGGTTTVAPSEIDETIDFLASEVKIGIGLTNASASINCLKPNFDESLALLMDMLRNPRFDEAQLILRKQEAVESMKQRNDDAAPILDREWSILLYGENHFESAEPTGASIASITPEKMRAFAARVFHPGSAIIAVSGDFDTAAMLAKLETAFASWPVGETVGDPPAPSSSFVPGVYHVQKDIPQGKVYIGGRAITRDDPDYFKFLVMNEILGGGGFTSRIMKSVRSDKGLAYSAGSNLSPRVWYPGEFRAQFQSKNATVAEAKATVFAEFDKMRAQLVSAEELDTAKKSFIETFPRTFESKPQMLNVFVADVMTKRDENYWRDYRANISSVTAEDVQAVAKKYLDPASMAIFIVGDWGTISNGDPAAPANRPQFSEDGTTHLPLRDPMTMQPMNGAAPAAPASK